jgi:hypothetical protein
MREGSRKQERRADGLVGDGKVDHALASGRAEEKKNESASARAGEHDGAKTTRGKRDRLTQQLCKPFPACYTPPSRMIGRLCCKRPGRAEPACRKSS